jgi:hypothetical protein
MYEDGGRERSTEDGWITVVFYDEAALHILRIINRHDSIIWVLCFSYYNRKINKK